MPAGTGISSSTRWAPGAARLDPAGSLGRVIPRALLLESIHPDARHTLGTAGFEVELLDHALPEQELLARLAGVSLLGIRSNTTVPSRVLTAAPDLLAVGAFCIGTNQVDLAAAADAA